MNTYLLKYTFFADLSVAVDLITFLKEIKRAHGNLSNHLLAGPWCFCIGKPLSIPLKFGGNSRIFTMVLILDGYSEISAHIKSKIGHLFSLKRSLTSRAVINLK